MNTKNTNELETLTGIQNNALQELGRELRRAWLVAKDMYMSTVDDRVYLVYKQRFTMTKIGYDIGADVFTFEHIKLGRNGKTTTIEKNDCVHVGEMYEHMRKVW